MVRSRVVHILPGFHLKLNFTRTEKNFSWIFVMEDRARESVNTPG